MIPIVATLLPIVNKVLDLIPDPNAKQKAQMEMQAALLEMSAKQAEQQSKINEVEAQHQSLFVAGWRPMIGWTCAFAFAFIYVVGPIVVWIGAGFGYVIKPPRFDADALLSLTLGMLGLGALRSFDKAKGTSR
jgi:Holin of 3TMs, for gene-transfer release